MINISHATPWAKPRGGGYIYNCIIVYDKVGLYCLLLGMFAIYNINKLIVILLLIEIV
jgi:hypothetical protein